ncbi:hypothetical protein A8C56_00050 [Niabella ginsenosidivorans]|uniref:ATP-binding protein n=1 Tax=Niabella ginsenosidivorans TaxID=1176587 RepID=A0A1A9HW19_9BACT|nr:AAA family ATPase [Niabella ginsenosidivorans]ANH79576.1 hypothetical protein A8C56_00050 [Niabella ginsenosidivorans]
MDKPLLIVITGRPASGKSTLANLLSRKIKCPLLSRDALKEGYVNTIGLQHTELSDAAAAHIYTTFFDAIDLLISNNISLIVEAAFQQKRWAPKLSELANKATIKVIVCKTDPDLSKKRFLDRVAGDPERERFHGDSLSRLINDHSGLFTDSYEQLNLDVPTLEVDTTASYSPHFNSIVAFVSG